MMWPPAAPRNTSAPPHNERSLPSNGRPSSNPERVHKINAFRSLPLDFEPCDRYPSLSDVPPTELEFQEHSSSGASVVTSRQRNNVMTAALSLVIAQCGGVQCFKRVAIAHLDTGFFEPRSSLLRTRCLCA
jgi:hypothetical protein